MVDILVFIILCCVIFIIDIVLVGAVSALDEDFPKLLLWPGIVLVICFNILAIIVSVERLL